MNTDSLLIAVYDIGKTNKKFILYNQELQPLHKASTRIDEKTVNGLITDDTPAITAWMKQALENTPHRDRIAAIAVTTFGATGVLLNGKDEPVIPVVSYNNEIPPETRKSFYREHGAPEELYMCTGTPPYGQLLNFAIQLHWIRETMPDKYQATKTILFLPQYLSYILTGAKTVEVTSAGCHTYLYDIPLKTWSHVAERLQVPEKTPQGFTEVWKPIGRARWLSHAAVTTGIHDSNASLLPLLVTGPDRNTVLASTGTWCVFMHPGAQFNPRREDVYRDVLYYVDAYSRPVKSARFKGGHEFEHYANLISRIFNVPTTSFLDMDAHQETARRILREKKLFITPTLTPGSGQFPSSKPRIIGQHLFTQDLKTAYHALNISIAAQTYYALKAMLGKPANIRLVVAGGFTRNPVYLKTLATMLRPHNSTVAKTEHSDLTSLGTAITALAALHDTPPHKLDTEPVKKALRETEIPPLPDIDDDTVTEYLEAFKEHCRKNTGQPA